MAHGGPGSVPSAARRSLVRLCAPRSPEQFGNTAFLIVLPHNSFCRRSRTQGVGGLRCRNCRVFGNEGYPWSKLGSIVFQFPFFNRSIFPDRRAFTDRLVPFLKKRPADHNLVSKFAIATGLTRSSQTCCGITRSHWFSKTDLGCQTH